MSIYTFKTIDSKYTLSERSMYGSSRVGMENVGQELGFRTINQTVTYAAYYTAQNYTGDKNYELSNHLGNVLEVITDRKLPIEGTTGITDYYTADVIAYNDYYPYGMIMPGRSGTQNTGDDYRYSFQGQEHDDEVKGKGNSINYKYRMHDPRVGRFFAVDPLAKELASLSPYQFSSNRPIDFEEKQGAIGGNPIRGYAGIGLNIALSNRLAIGVSAQLGATYNPYDLFSTTGLLNISGKMVRGENSRAEFTGSITGNLSADLGSGAGNFYGRMVTDQMAIEFHDYESPSGFNSENAISIGLQAELVGSNVRRTDTGFGLSATGQFSVFAGGKIESTDASTGSFNGTVTSGGLYGSIGLVGNSASTRRFNISLGISESSYSPLDVNINGSVNNYTRTINSKYNLNLSIEREGKGLFGGQLNQFNAGLTTGGSFLGMNQQQMLNLNVNYSNSNGIGLMNRQGTSVSAGYGVSTINNSEVVP